MLTDLLQKLEAQHGIAPAQGQNILNTITQQLKEKFPMVGNMLDNVIGGNAAAANTSGAQPNVHESKLQQLEELAKGKLGGLFGG